ncbi:MAG: isoleucine--tRNA ligase [Candidatus Aminicenantes bacterium]|nr:isoleucine--tRNA ligase [Candidatus Aminicenantes bacterium]MDH5705559.1 isoleucine--tRNA ligase [Candidatus Aminicenantes bacterium]
MADGENIKDTLNLPQTSFSMKAKLSQKEPEIIKKWETMNLYQKIQQKREKSPSFILHDGPPYANGSIHLGTALNKILKDFIVKTKTMQGFRSPYLPGWDCHGLPIEIKVDQLLGAKKRGLSIIEIREECKKYALKYVDIQRNQFKRLGIFGEWEKPYLTMDPEYEGEVIRYLAAFFATGNVYKGKRPVHWCPHCKTALAEAEIEYKDRKSPSIYVKFPMISDLSQKFPELKGKKVSVLIWTTTPWTLPANLAIAFHPEYEYAAFETGGEVFIAAKRLIPVLAEELGFKQTQTLVTFLGKELEGLKARHPFIDRESVFVLADYVTLDQGTGSVHTAPGHGYEDYLTGIAVGLDIYTPVDSEGKFVPQVEKYGEMNVFEANTKITEDMKADGSLLKEGEIIHSYPHCWRCKNPVIFRATAQWFIAMDTNDLRNKALEEIKKVRWIPPWGEERIANMVSARPDWCISRQRSWGVPIPAFYCHDCGHILADEKTILRIADVFSKEGSNSWFLKEAGELLPADVKCPQCGSQRFNKENNILDVWFESGASHNVLGKRPDLPWPSDVYVEGNDQYRGWFNSSLFIGVAAKKASPYKAVITHGFVLDEQGRGMSKSLGNFVDPDEVISKNGAEILRLWVAMLNYKEDARFGNETLQRLVEAYRKIRNTWRFILGNIYDFSPDEEKMDAQEMESLDKWILERCRKIGKKILKAYENYEYHIVFHTIYNFFTVDLSAYYLDVIKDRLYCSGKKSQLRRSAQTALFELLKSTLVLMVPILPFTTEEAWEVMPSFRGKEESVHLESFPEFEEKWLDERTYQEWENLIDVREIVLKELERAREENLIGNSLEAVVSLKVPSFQEELLRKYEKELPAVFIVSSVELEPHSGEELETVISKAPWEKCQRCWNFSPYVGKNPEYPHFCERCEGVVKSMHS